MTARLSDGAVVGIGGREFTAVCEPPDEDGHGFMGWECARCEVTFRGGDDALSDHECFECPGCGDWYPKLPVTDTENGQSYCTDDCHEDASERYWTAVWTA